MQGEVKRVSKRCISHIAPSKLLVLLPEQVDILTIQPIRHSLVHIVPALVASIGQIVQDLVAQGVLGSGQVLVSFRVLVQLFLGERGNVLAVDWDHLVLLVEELDVLRLPLSVLDLGEEDEPAVALNVDWDALEDESLRDGGLHLSNTSLLGQVDVGERAVLSVHDEVAVLSALDRHVDEVFNGKATGPCWEIVSWRHSTARSYAYMSIRMHSP